jgi:hypothetical protein
VLSVACAAVTSVSVAGERTQSFDSDPGWEGVNNRVVPKNRPTVRQDFGYADGKMGGLVTRASEPAYYGAAIGDKTLDDKLSASGTYSPTLTQTTNVSSSTPAACQYMRIGNVVTVSGVVSVTCTAGASTPTTLGISLPIASDLAATTQCGGAGRAATASAGISANVISNVASVDWLASASGAQTLCFTFTYLIV